MASAELSRRVGRVVGDPPLSEMGDLEHCLVTATLAAEQNCGHTLAVDAPFGDVGLCLRHPGARGRVTAKEPRRRVPPTA